MASTLHNFINRTTIERGIEFDQAYTLTPTRTGTNSSGTFILSGNAPVYESTVGPRFGSGSWKMQVNKTVGSTRIGVETGANSADLTGFSDNNWGIGIWFKLNNVVTSQYSYENEIEILTCGGFRLSVSSSLWGSGAQGTRFMYSTNGSSYNTMQATGHTAVEAGRWYHLAVRNVSGTYTFFIDGVAVRTLSGISAITPSTLLFGTTNTTGTGTSANITYNMSNFHYGTATQMSEEVIRGIYGVGATTAGAVYALGPESYYRFDSNDSTPDNVGATYTDAGSYLGNGSETIGTTTTPTISAGYTVITPTSTTPFRYFQGTMPWGYPANSISLFFKSASKPTGDVKFLTGGSGNYSFGSTTTESHIGSDGKLRWGGKWGSTTVYSVDSTVDICDGEWHHVVVYRDGFEIGIYIDGTLDVTQAIGTSANLADLANIQVNSIVGSTAMYIDELAIYDYRLTNSNVSSIWAARPISAVNISYAAAVMAVSNATLPMPVHTAETVINVSYTSGIVGTASADIVDPVLSASVNLDAFGVVGTASADIVNSTVDVTANINYIDGIMTASGLMTTATISTERTLNYSASPATASALLSSNVYYGPTLQDSSYNLLMRQIGETTNTEAKNGFAIGTQYTNSTLDSRTSLLLRNANGVPPYGTIIKAKFDPAHLTIGGGGDASPSNTFNIYVFTEAPASWTTFNYTNLPAKQLISTSRLVDDGSNSQFHLDLTAAANDSRAYTYGIFIEHVGTPPYSGTIYDRTEFNGTGLDVKLMYILTSDFASKNINASPMTVSALQTEPTLSLQRYVNFADSAGTASADIINPTVSAQDYVAIDPMVVTASAELIQPAFARSANYVSDHLEAFADTYGFTVHVTANVSLAISPFLTSGLAVMPTPRVGEDIFPDPFTASVTMPGGTVTLSTVVAAPINNTVSIDLIHPTITVQLKGQILAEPMLAQNATIVTPGEYIDYTKDVWFNSMYASHSIRNSQGAYRAKAKLQMFEKVSSSINPSTPPTERIILSQLPTWIVNNYPISASVEALNPTYSGITVDYYTATKNAEMQVGYFDDNNRRAVRWNNAKSEFASSETATERFQFTMEFSIKTTKSNQIIATGSRNNSYGSEFSTSYNLVDGKLNYTNYTGSYYTPRHPKENYNQLATQVTGTVRVDDGQWHHVFINAYGGRFQIFVDGKLDIQRFETFIEHPDTWGNNSASDYSIDLITSGYSIDLDAFAQNVDQVFTRYLNYVKYTPVSAPTSYASAVMTQGNEGKGNRARALMLYFWPNWGPQKNSLQKIYNDGSNGAFDVETFDPYLSTMDWANQPPQQYYGWDVFPVDVNGYYVSDLVKKEAYGQENIRISQLPYSISGMENAPTAYFKTNRRGWFRDSQTDSRRYIDLVKDIDLSQFDAIFFANYPDDSKELDDFARNEVVDDFFNLRESVIFEDFVKSLRKAVDTGISLFVTNPQLALDLKIVDRIEVVADLKDTGYYYSDPLSPTIAPTEASFLKGGGVGSSRAWHDFDYNNKNRIVNTISGLTDIPGIIHKNHLFWQNDDRLDFGGPDHAFDAYEIKANGLNVGDEFLMSTTQTWNGAYQAVPFANIKAGKAVTAFGANYYRGTTLLENPYVNYATSIAVSPGDILDGKQVGGKIFVNFTENLPKSSDFGTVELIQDKWINLAYDEGIITLANRNQLLNAPENLDRKLESGALTQTQYNRESYWSFNGMNILAQVTKYDFVVAVDQGGAAQATSGANGLSKSNAGDAATTGVYATYKQPWFQFKYSNKYQTLQIKAPSILTRGFWWLSKRLESPGLVNRPIAFTGTSQMVMPTITADKFAAPNVQAMIAVAGLSEAQGYSPTSAIVAPLPLEANARITDYVTNIKSAPMLSTARFADDVLSSVSSIDEIILYVMHEEPILYLREDIIK